MPTCAVCAVDIQEGQAVLLRGKKNSPPISVCATCADDMERAIRVETEAPNLAGGLVAGLAAAAVASLIWYGVVAITEYQLGLVALLVGWLVGKAVMLGAGGKRGISLQLMSVGITLPAMVLGEYFIVRHFIVEALKANGESGFRLFLPVADMFEVVLEGIRIEPTTLLFWALALWVAFRTPAARQIRRQSPWSPSPEG